MLTGNRRLRHYAVTFRERKRKVNQTRNEKKNLEQIKGVLAILIGFLFHVWFFYKLSLGICPIYRQNAIRSAACYKLFLFTIALEIR